MKLFSFEKLVVWQKARHLSILIYKSTKFFPEEEKFGLHYKNIGAKITEITAMLDGLHKSQLNS